MSEKAVADEKDISKSKSEFVDRVPLTSAFEAELSKFKKEMNSGSIKVINYYGVGGIGKSTLLAKIKDDILDKNSDKNDEKETSRSIVDSISDTIGLFGEKETNAPAKNLVVYYDMDNSTERVDIIFKLKTLLINECGFKFPKLEVVHRVFDYLSGENVKITEIKSLIDEAESYSGIGVEVLGEFPGIGPFFKMFKAYNDVRKIKVKRFNSRESLNEFLKEKSKAPLDMEEDLEKIFISELKWNLKDIQEPLVIMFDRFEKTKNQKETLIKLPDKDQWIFCEDGLIDQVNKVLWVIAGRDPLDWAKYEPWKDIIETNEVNKLEDPYAKELLQRGVIPSELCDELIPVTGGIPEYIKLCLKHAQYLISHNIKEINNITKDDFCVNNVNNNRDTRNKLATRFIDHLPEKETTMLTYLSIFDDWTDDMIEKVVPKVWSNYEDYIYQRVKDLPFFEFKENGKCEMKEVIRNVISTKLKAENPKIVNKIHSEIIEYLKSDLHVNNCEEEL